jgi:hypothetical protein
MKDVGFLALLQDRNIKTHNEGFMKDQYGRRGVSCMATIKDKSYAIWFMQLNFPEGIYTIAVTKLDACTIVPMYEYIETKDIQKVFEFVDKISEGVDETNPENITHPWTELSKRIMEV